MSAGEELRFVNQGSPPLTPFFSEKMEDRQGDRHLFPHATVHLGSVAAVSAPLQFSMAMSHVSEPRV